MGEFAPIVAHVDEDEATPAFPTLVLARWAALASARACLGSIPAQVLG